MNSQEPDNAEWIDIRPSNVNLGLTLVAPVCALAILFLIDVPDWVRAVLAFLLLIVTVIDIYHVRMRAAHAVAAFRLIRRTAAPTALAEPGADAQVHALTPPADPLAIQLKYRYPARNGGVAETEGLVNPRCYVSTYFTSISYRLATDPSWRRWFPRVLSIWADGIDKDAFRRVRVVLKWR
jgi:hypothetical protein